MLLHASSCERGYQHYYFWGYCSRHCCGWHRQEAYTVIMGVLIVRGLVYTRSGVCGSGADSAHYRLALLQFLGCSVTRHGGGAAVSAHPGFQGFCCYQHLYRGDDPRCGQCPLNELEWAATLPEARHMLGLAQAT